MAFEQLRALIPPSFEPLKQLGQPPQALPGNLRMFDQRQYSTPAPTPTPAMETPKLQNGQLLPYKPTTLQRIKDALRKFNQKAGETAEFVGQAGAGPLTDIASAAFRPRGNDLKGLSPYEQERIQKEWAPESFRRSPETAQYISPTTAEIASIAGSVYPYLIAGPAAALLGAAPVEAAVGKYLPKVASTVVGKALPKMAEQGATFGGLAAIEEAVRGMSEPEKFDLAQSVKRILSSTGEGVLFGAGQEFIGAPLKNVAARIPALSKPGVVGTAGRTLAGAATEIAAGSPVIGLHMAEGATPQDAAKEAVFFGAMGVAHGALGGPADYAARVRRINEAKGYVPKIEEATRQAEAEIAARRAELEKPTEKPAEAPQAVPEAAPVAEPSPVTAESPGTPATAPTMSEHDLWRAEIERNKQRAEKMLEMPQEGYLGLRLDVPESGISAETAEAKPHGLYMSIVDDRNTYNSWHTDVGDTAYWGRVKPKNPLVVPDILVEHARFHPFSRGGASAGVAALKELLPEAEFERLRKASKAELVKELNQKYPGPNYKKYYDSYELLEAYAANLARERGYDAIIQVDRESPENSEMVALKNDIVSLEPPQKWVPPSEQAPVEAAPVAEAPAEVAATAEAPVTTPESAVTSDIQQQLLARVSAAEGNVAERGSVMLPGRRSKTAEPIMTLSDPEAEKRFQQSKALPEKTLKEHAAEIKQDIQKALSKYDIPRNDPYFADVRRKLTEMESKMDFISDEVVREYDGLLMNLEGNKAAKNDLLGKALAILDSVEDLEAGKEVFPFGWTKESLPIDKAKLDETLLQHPDVAKAVEERRALYKAVTDENVAANKAIGRDNTDLFQRGNYFRHMVIERLQGIKPKETGKRLKTPSGRGYMKERKGSELDIYTNHIDVDILTLAQIKYDTEVAKLIGLVKSPKYNIYDSLRAEARKQNDALIREHFAAMAEVVGGDAESLYKQTLNMRQAIGADKLQKLAKAGELHDDGRWTDLIEEIKAGSAEMPEMMPYMAWVLKVKPESEAAIAAATVFKGMRLKANYIRDNLGDKFVTWRDVIPEGWEAWQPDPGNLFFSAYTISDKLAEKMLNGVLPEVAQKDVHRILAIGGKKPSFVIRSELASTFNNLKDTRANSTIAKIFRFLQGQWKQYVLTGPKSVVSYNVHNMGSDLDVMMFAPKVMLKTPQAAEDLMALTMGKAGPKGELKEWLRRGGEASTMSVQEAGAVNELKLFHEYVAKRKNWTPRQLWDGWFKAARKATSTREALLRYSAYLHYLDEIQKSPTGLPKKFGASIPSEIRGLTDPRDKAFVLANDLLGAYNEVSRTGKWVRENMLFFWSFQEINLRRYWQLFKNEVNTEANAKAMAEGYVKGIAKVVPGGAFHLGTFLLKASAWWVALQTYNNMVHPDLEEELPADVRSRSHIVLGRGPDGKVIYYDRLSASQDVLEWFGLDDLPQDYRDVLDGRKGFKDFAVDALKSSVNKVIQGMGPHVKLLPEAVLRRKLYPDAFSGTPIRDIGEWLASQVRLNEEYARLKGLPAEPFDWRTDPARLALGFRTADPGESAYYDVLDLKSQYLKSIGKPTSFGGSEGTKSLALYNLRKAARLGDEQAYKRFYEAYKKAGGTREGLRTSLRNLDPLHGLSSSDKRAFLQWLRPEDKTRLDEANAFYRDVILRNAQTFK